MKKATLNNGIFNPYKAEIASLLVGIGYKKLETEDVYEFKKDEVKEGEDPVPDIGGNIAVLRKVSKILEDERNKLVVS